MILSPARSRPAVDDDGVDLTDLARRLAGELDSAVAIADDCQAAFGEVLESGLTQALAMRLQALDLLSQRLGDVSALLQRLGGQAAAGVVPLHLFDAMRLSDVSSRLTGGGAHEPAERDAEFW